MNIAVIGSGLSGLTPVDFRTRTHLAHHTFGGIRPVMGAWRVPHQSPVEGLWFVGAQSESGGGVNSVMPGASKTARQIAQVAANTSPDKGEASAI